MRQKTQLWVRILQCLFPLERSLTYEKNRETIWEKIVSRFTNIVRGSLPLKICFSSHTIQNFYPFEETDDA